MAAIANLTLTDAAGTPVNHTYVPQDCTSELATWNETAGGISIGMPQFTFSLKLGQNGQANKVSGKLTLPTLETVSGQDASGYVAVPTLAYTCIGKFELTLPARATLQNRKDVRAMIQDALSDAIVTTAITSFERPF
ncbi:coat protein [ssRNA phage Gerhypos.2_26]|uniref:Coat protein n=2 Tax=Fiersviridae TaxID=2842319 RepID=A0A8S5L077_9VIRU|nr:coat protein [ssRNA phage Gerhypos.2_26]QDH91515.1 MAG: hypothetical protein H2Bulk35384_000002 [Leviviridae sp.]DAD51342.1 TPA_asm: coat protein [ssRNA phage Gerhypos.2_26]